MFDMHMHTEFSPDTDTPLRAQITSAKSKGLDGICVTDHIDIDAPYYPKFGPDASVWENIDFDAYFQYIADARENAGIQIGAGLEIGLEESNLDKCRERIAPYEFDFIIASFHYFNGKDPFFPDFFEGRELKRLFEDYYTSAYNCLKRYDRYSVVGHLTYLYKCTDDFDTDIKYTDYPDIFDEILKRVIETGHGLEINTSSLRRKEKPMPPYDILSRYRELGGEILTIGSDAHYPEHVGFMFEDVKECLKEIGFKYACWFKDMKPQFYEV